MDSTQEDATEPTKRIWHLRTSLSKTIANSLFNRRKTPIQKEGELLEQLRDRHQALVIRLPNENGKTIKVIIPIVISGEVRPVEQIEHYVDNNYPDLEDSDYDLIEEAYNEWYDMYTQTNVNPQVKPVLTTAQFTPNAESSVLAEASRSHTNTNSNDNRMSNSLARATVLPYAYKIGRGKKTKKQQKSKSKSKKQQKSKKGRK